MDIVETQTQYPIGGFTTIHVANLYYGKVDPDFVKTQGNALGNKWKFRRPDGQYKMVDFEGCDVYPVLSTGWLELREVYGLELQNETTHIGYYGENVFELLATGGTDNSEEYPTFHNRCTNKRTTVYFDLKLSGISAQKSKLKLSGRFEEYVRGHGMRQVRLCSDNGYVTIFDVYCKDNPSNSTKIGDGWNQFCQCNNFNDGDTIRFRYIYVGRQAIFRVFKV